MTSSTQNLNPILAKIHKLLALADAVRNNSEAEATAAGLKAQQLMQDYGLSMAELESTKPGSAAEEPRDKVYADRRAMYQWQQDLMSTLAVNNFCLHRIGTQRVMEYGKYYNSKRHMLVGRRANIDMTVMLYDYLVKAMGRAADEAGYARTTRESAKENNYFLAGAVTRLTGRLNAQRREREAAEQAAVDAARAAGQATNALVLTDVYGTEEDLNNDKLSGFPAGTTAARRAKRNADEAARRATEERLVAEGVDKTEAFYRSHGYSDEQSTAYAKQWKAKSGRSGRGRGWSSGWTQSDAEHSRKVNSGAYRAGQIAGARIGLDAQVGRSTQKVIK